mgnify:CR=1 FL=1
MTAHTQRTPHIPQPQLRTVRNLTPFPHFQCDKMAPGRALYDTLVVKGTYELVPDRLRLAEVQTPVVLADEYWDPSNATRSCVRTAGDVMLTKPATDILVTGTARTPGRRSVPAWDVAVS